MTATTLTTHGPALYSTDWWKPVENSLTRWNLQHRETPAQYALKEWDWHIAADGRYVHTVRVDCPDPVTALTQAVAEAWVTQDCDGVPQHPVADYETPGRVTYAWLVGNAWIALWAPATTVQDPAGACPSIPNEVTR